MNKIYTVTQPYLPDKQELYSYIDRIYESKWLTNQGPLHQEFEKKLENFLDIPNVTLHVNGHLALENALLSFNFPQGAEVITTPFTFVSTTHAISLCGLTPVFCDVKKTDMTIDEEKIENLITDKTVAILAVHVYGHPCNVKKIQEIADRHSLKVIYDAAHAFGVKIHGKSIVSYGDISMLSFHATKLFHSIEGGALAYKDSTKKELFDKYKNFGIKNEEEIPFIGRNAKMNEFQSAMGLCCLNHIDELINKRKKLSMFYREFLRDCSAIHYFTLPESVIYNYAYFPIIVCEENSSLTRDQLYDKLKSIGIGTRKYFYPLISEAECYQHLIKVELPVAQKYGMRVLTLPLYHSMEYTDVEYICETIKELVK